MYCFPGLYEEIVLYITLDLFHLILRVLLMYALILYCAIKMFNCLGTPEISCPKCHFSSAPNHQFRPRS